MHDTLETSTIQESVRIQKLTKTQQQVENIRKTNCFGTPNMEVC